MKKTMALALVLSVFLLGSMMTTVFAAPPPISRQMEIVTATIDGGDPQTVDPAYCYDTASGELLTCIYDTLVFFDGEHMDRYLPQLATSWTIKQNNPPIHDAATGLDWYYTYTFAIRDGVHFWDGSTLTTADVEYTFERGMVLDMDGGPQWMFYEPLLNGAYHDYVNGVDYDIEGTVADEILVGKMIDHAIGSNATHVWFNLAFNGAYAPFMQILSQSWASIYSKSWALGLGRSSIWPGTWGSYDGWSEYCNPGVPPLDDPDPVAMGTGPFEFANLDRTLMYWDAYRFEGYWRGWGSGPAPNYGIGWPAFGGSKPAGYIDHYKVSWAWDWPTRSTMFLAGDVDYCSVPRQYIGDIVGKPNIRCIYPLPSLSVDAFFYNQAIDPTTPFGNILGVDAWAEAGIPTNMFSYIAVRKAFSHLIDFTTFLSTIYLGEAVAPQTAIIPGLPQYDGTIVGYDYNPATASALLQSIPGLWTNGFTIQLCYNQGNLARKWLAEHISAELNALNPKIHASATEVIWSSYLYARDHGQLTAFILGWLADYPDAHNFAYAFYYTYGNFAWRAAYSNPTMDALIESGIATPDGPARMAIYHDIQQLAIDDCPCVTVDQAIGRHFEVSWINGWYYNPIYSGIYPANHWKWYYTPQAQQDTVTNTTANLLPYDVNYDGKTNMVDIGTTAASFGAIYGPPMSAKWVYRCDFNNDRKIDMKDIGGVAKNFGKTSGTWAPVV